MEVDSKNEDEHKNEDNRKNEDSQKIKTTPKIKKTSKMKMAPKMKIRRILLLSEFTLQKINYHIKWSENTFRWQTKY